MTLPLFLSEQQVAEMVLGPERAKEWPAKLKVLEQKAGFPRKNRFYGGYYRPAIEQFIAEDVGFRTADLPVTIEVADRHLAIVPYPEDGESHATPARPLDRRRRTVR